MQDFKSHQIGLLFSFIFPISRVWFSHVACTYVRSLWSNLCHPHRQTIQHTLTNMKERKIPSFICNYSIYLTKPPSFNSAFLFHGKWFSMVKRDFDCDNVLEGKLQKRWFHVRKYLLLIRNWIKVSFSFCFMSGCKKWLCY